MKYQNTLNLCCGCRGLKTGADSGVTLYKSFRPNLKLLTGLLCRLL